MNESQIKFLSNNFGKEYAKVESGVVKKALTGEIIPKEHITKYFNYKDGLYELGECTCDGSLTLGTGKGKAEPTEENKEKYQCRIGRRAPKCDMYAKGKCAVYSFSGVDDYKINISATDLIKIFNINNIDKF